MGTWGNCFPFMFILFLSHASTFINEDNSGHDILELYPRKIFYLSENVHSDKFCESANQEAFWAEY